jgi:E3 SUMO-protein ligase PIAS1
MSFETAMPPYNSGDPSASFLSSSALDFLLIELVPLAYRVTNEAPATTPQNTGSSEHNAGAAAATTTATTSPSQAEDDEALEAVRHKLEMTGYRVGQGLVERYVYFGPSSCLSMMPYTYRPTNEC